MAATTGVTIGTIGTKAPAASPTRLLKLLILRKLAPPPGRSSQLPVFLREKRIRDGPPPFVGTLDPSVTTVAQRHPAAVLALEDRHQRWPVSAEQAADAHLVGVAAKITGAIGTLGTKAAMRDWPSKAQPI